MTDKERDLVNAVKVVQTAFYNLTGNEDAFNYNRLGEVLTAIALGLNWNAKFKGEDAIDPNGNPIELKSTTQKNINGTYNGLSVYENREDFIEYLYNKYPSNTRHIFTRKERGEIAEVYEMNNSDVLNILIDKTAKDWTNGKFFVTRKDRRVGATVCMTEIKKYGEKLELHRQ